MLCKILLLPLVQFLEVVRLEGHAFSPEDVALARDMYLLQVSFFIVVVFKDHCFVRICLCFRMFLDIGFGSCFRSNLLAKIYVFCCSL